MLTDKQNETSAFISSFISKNERRPRLREIAKHFHIKLTAAYWRVRRIKENSGKCLWCDRTL